MLNPASTRRGWFRIVRLAYGGLKRSETTLIKCMKKQTVKK